MRSLRLAATLVAALLLALGPAHAQPDPSKTLRVAFLIAETGFDPQAVSDFYSNHINRVIFDAPFRYDYLARPFKVIPNTTLESSR